MGSKNNITKEVKDNILSFDCNYDYVYEELENNFEHAMSGVLKGFLYLFKNIDNVNNKDILDNLVVLLNNYINDHKNKKILDKMYSKIQVFLDNVSKNFSYLNLLSVEKYISELIDLQNKCLSAPLKKCNNDRYNFIMYLVFFR